MDTQTTNATTDDTTAAPRFGYAPVQPPIRTRTDIDVESDLDILTVATPAEVEALVNDHGTTVENLAERHARLTRELADLAPSADESPGRALVKAEQRVPLEAELRQLEQRAVALLDRVEPVAHRAAELLVERAVTLDDFEMEKATARMAFVEEDCERLPLPALRDAIAAALRREDRVGLFLFVRYAPARLEKADRSGSDAWGDGRSDEATRVEVGSLLAKATAKLTAETVHPGHGRAVEVRNAAQELRSAIVRVRIERETDAQVASGTVVRW